MCAWQKMVTVCPMHPVKGSPALGCRETWSIPGAALVGVGGSLAFILLAYSFSSLIKPYGYAMAFSRFRAREATALAAQIGAGLVLLPILLSIARRRCSEGFWASIGWNSTRLDVLPSVLFGGLLAVAVSVGLTAKYGSAGSLRTPADLVLYVLSEVLVGSLIEETYFRGILFSALANRLGGARLHSHRHAHFFSCTSWAHILRISGNGNAWIYAT